MVALSLDLKNFELKMNNIINYSNGFIEGINKGKHNFLRNLATSTIDALYDFVDSNARLNPKALHHVYEWYRTGSPSARLFNIDYSIMENGISLKSSFSQSKSLANGSSVPFYDKARIMEDGIPVTISPKKNKLVFNINGETIFTSNDVFVENPGGQQVQGSFEKVFNLFMSQYFKQSFLKASGIYDYLSRPKAYKENIARGAKSGKTVGTAVGYNWISNAKAGNING